MVRLKPGLSHESCLIWILALISIALLRFCAGIAAGECPKADSVLEKHPVRDHLENCLKSYIFAAKDAELFQCPGNLGASFSKKWAELMRSDLLLLEHETRYLMLSEDSQTRNRGMDEIIALLAETKSRIERLQAIAHRFASRYPTWARHLTPLLKEGESSSDEAHKIGLRRLTKSLFTNLSRCLVEARVAQSELRARQQDALARLAQTRSELAAQKEQLDAVRSIKERALANVKSGPDGEKAVSAVLSHCRKMLLGAIRDADLRGTRGSNERLPRRFPPPIASKPEHAPSADSALGPTLVVAPRSPIYSVAQGGVVLSEYIPGFGLTIVLRQGERDMTVFSHLSASFVSPDDQVNVGQRIGLSGESGVVARPSLLFALLRGGKLRDPVQRTNWPGS